MAVSTLYNVLVARRFSGGGPIGFEEKPMGVDSPRLAGAENQTAERSPFFNLLETDAFVAFLRKQIASKPLAYQSRQEREDVFGEVCLSLLGHSGEVDNPRAFAAKVVRSVLFQMARDTNPRWLRLSDKITKAVRQDPALAVWQADNGTRLCGLSEWSGRPSFGSERLSSWLAKPETVRKDLGQDARRNPEAGALCRIILKAAGSPLPIPMLVHLAFELSGHKEVCVVSLDLAEEFPSAPEVGSFDAERSFAITAAVVLRLRKEPAASYFFNLDSYAADCLLRHHSRGSDASKAELAIKLGTSAEDLEDRIDRELPKQDLGIAAFLGLYSFVTGFLRRKEAQQKVINWRQTAKLNIKAALSRQGLDGLP